MALMEKLEQSHRELIAGGAFDQAERLRRDIERLEAIRMGEQEKRKARA